jgi:hypothetical protein
MFYKVIRQQLSICTSSPEDNVTIHLSGLNPAAASLIHTHFLGNTLEVNCEQSAMCFMPPPINVHKGW